EPKLPRRCQSCSLGVLVVEPRLPRLLRPERQSLRVIAGSVEVHAALGTARHRNRLKAAEHPADLVNVVKVTHQVDTGHPASFRDLTVMMYVVLHELGSLPMHFLDHAQRIT